MPSQTMLMLREVKLADFGELPGTVLLVCRAT